METDLTIRRGQNRLPEPRPLTLPEMTDYDCLCQRSAGRQPSTIGSTRLALSKLNAYLESQGLPTQIEAITPDVIRNHILNLGSRSRFEGHPFTPRQSQSLTRAAVNGYLRAQRAAFNRWQTDGMITNNPFKGIRIPAPHYKVREAPTDDEIKRLAGAIHTSRPAGFGDYVLFLTYLDTGARLSGLITTPMAKVDLEHGRIQVTEKGGKERSVFIGRTLRPLLWKWIKRYRPDPLYLDGDLLFLTTDGRPLTKQRVEGKFRKYALEAGLDPHRLTPHCLRHYFCTKFVRNGGTLSDLQAISGHSDIKSLSIYLHPAPDDLATAHGHCSPLDYLRLNTSGKGWTARNAE